jgi:hypothetical protein
MQIKNRNRNKEVIENYMFSMYVAWTKVYVIFEVLSAALIYRI